jgi:hypothetical protein
MMPEGQNLLRSRSESIYVAVDLHWIRSRLRCGVLQMVQPERNI